MRFLQRDIAEYKKDYGTKLEGYFTPFYEPFEYSVSVS